MKVLLNEIREIFDDLIEEKKSREEIVSWASQRQAEDDADNLELEPPDEEEIWEGIICLMGVDLRDWDGEYLHSTENFIDFRRENNL